MKEQVERRKDRRFGLTPSAHVAFGPHFCRVGQMTDISRSGLSFRYIGYQDSSESSELDVLSAHSCFLKMSFETICDFEMASEFFLGSIPIRRRSVHFRNLTHDHKSKLRRFIENCTAGETDA
jgi:hypothetical protein